MKKIVTFIVILLAVSGVAFTQRTEIVNAIGAILRSGMDVPSGSLKMQTSISTTTPNFLQFGTGTTTLTFATDNFDAVAVNMQVFASTTNKQGALEIKPQSSDNGVDFFDYDYTVTNPATLYPATTTVALASTTVSFRYSPSTLGATTTKAFNIGLIPARFTRLTFSVASSSGSGATDNLNLWVNIIGKTNGVK